MEKLYSSKNMFENADGRSGASTKQEIIVSIFIKKKNVSKWLVARAALARNKCVCVWGGQTKRQKLVKN